MEIKKSVKADLERKKPIYLQVGLVLALSLSLFAFEYKSYDKVEEEAATVTQAEVIEEVVMQTKQEVKPETPPPAQAQTTLLTIVDNSVQVTNDVEIDAGDQGEANKEVAYQEVAQETAVEAEEAQIFSVVEESPSYPGGDQARMTYLKDNLKYPQLARESNIDGTVYIEFVVERDGSISKPTIKRDIGGGCGEEALRVVKAMPKWAPGKQRGKPVRTQFVLPIKFILN